MLIGLLLFFQWGQSLTYANEQNDIEEKAKEAGGNEVDNKIEVDDHEQIDNDRNLTNFNTSEFEIQPNSTGVTIAKYLGAGGSVVIPETIEGKPVTIIGNLAFYESNLTEIVIPESVITIGDWAFAKTQLSTIVIPDSVADIGRWTFQNSKLTSVTISKNLTTIGDQAFYGNQLVHVDIPDGVTDIGYQAFFGNRLTTVNIPDSVTKIGTQAFTNNRITNLKIPNSVISIGDEAFGYNQLINVELPNSITRIGNYVFDSNKLTTVNIPNSVTSIGKGAFQVNYLTNIDLPNSLLTLEQGAFYNNRLKSIVIPSNVTSIGDWVFGQNRLTSVDLPNSLLSIGKMAFYDNQLSNVTFPHSVTSIGDKAFELNRLQWVQFNSPLMLGTNTFINQGSTFEGWYQNLSWATQWDGNVTKPLRIYAKGNVQQHTVTFETNNDSTTIEEQKVLTGEKVVEPNAPVKTGFTFGGWYKDEELNIPWSFDTDVITENKILYAKWLKNSHTVTFHFDTYITTVEVPDGALLNKPSIPIKEGHKFFGWFNKDRTAEWDFERSRVTFDIDLYAVWLKNVYGVRFEAGNNTTPIIIVAEYGDKLEEPEPPILAGQIFAGWYKNPALNKLWNFATDVVTEHTTLYAKWDIVQQQYVVQFESNGGSLVPSQTINSYMTATKPENPIKVGYTFAGWYKDKKFTTLWEFEIDKVTENITLYAKWDLVQQYELKFESNGGSSVPSQTFTSPMKATKPINPTKTGHLFVDWYKDAELNRLWNFETDRVTEDTTLYAKWEKVAVQYTLDFETNGGSAVASQKVTEDTFAIKPANPTKAGYEFAGWYTDAVFSKPWNFTTDKVTKNTILYAKWEKVSVQYTLDFETNGGSAVVSQKVTEDNFAIKPADPTKAGYEFVGWYTDAVFSTPWNFTTDKVTENTILYAKWEKVVAQYTVNFETNGGSAIPSQKVTDKAKVTKPTNPTKAGYILIGWYKDETLNIPWDFDIDVITENLTLYAKWEKLSMQYTVDFETNGGSTVASQKVTNDTLATRPVDPTKAGYTFTGWYKDIALTIPWDFSKDVVKSNITLYAHWVTDGSSGGGGSISPNPSPIPEPNIPEKQEPKPEEPIDPQPTEPTPQQEPEIIFSDISQGHWGWAMIQEMAKQGIITGYQDGTFKPNAPIQRQHAALILTRALELEPKQDTREFNDIPKSHLYFEVIDQVQQAGLFEGIDGNFQPTTNLTRAQMAKVLVLAFNLTSSNKDTFEDVPKTHWAHNFIAILAGNGITIGDNGNFRPNDPVTRAEFVAFLYRALHQ